MSLASHPMSILLLVLAAGASVSDAQLLRNGPCPNVNAMANFNISQFMGTWFEQIHTKRWPGMELDCNCQMFYQNSNTNFSYDSFTYSPTIDRVFYQYDDVVIKPYGNSSQKNFVLDRMGDDVKSCVFLLATDYTSFATMWTCTPVDDLHFENVIILTRERLGKSAALIAGMKALDANNITRQQLMYTNQRKCPDFTLDVFADNSSMPSMPDSPTVNMTTLNPSGAAATMPTTKSVTMAPPMPATSGTMAPPKSATMTPPMSATMAPPMPATMAPPKSATMAPPMSTTSGSMVTTSGSGSTPKPMMA